MRDAIRSFALFCLATAAATPALAQAPRLVVLGGSLTEIAYDLGAQNEIVGVDSTSVYPPSALAEHSNVGYVRALSAEGLLSTNPSRVLAIEGAGPPEVLAQISGAGVDVVRIADKPTPDGIVAKIRAVGQALGRKAEAEALAGNVEAGFAALEASRAALTTKRRVLFVLSLQNGRPLVAGHDTLADGMIALAGGKNAAARFQGYKPMTDEAIVDAQPDVVLMMDNAGAPRTEAATLFGLPAFAQTPAAKTAALVTMDGNYLLGFGPRAPAAAAALMARLYEPAAGGP